MASAVLRGIGGFLVGLIGGGAAAFAIGLTAGELLGVSQFEGAYVMSVAFFITPVAGLVLGILGAVLGARSARPRPDQPKPPMF